MRCGGKSEHQERMMDLTVEIEGEITTLVEALRRFTSTETLDGENKYHCVRWVDFLDASSLDRYLCSVEALHMELM